MRSRLKQVVFAAVIAALTVAGLSIANGGGGGGEDRAADSSEAGTSFDVREQRGPGGRMFHRFKETFGDADVREVLKDIREAVADQAPEIAGPVIEKAESDGKITGAQADKLRQAAQDIADGKKPDIGDLARDEDVREVIHDAFEAAHDKTPGIAKPIIDKAVADEKITEAQADRIKELVRRGPLGGKPGVHRFHGPPGFADEDVREVLEDIHDAVAAQASDIAKPVIDKAESDGKVTAAQADRLRELVADLHSGKPPAPPGRDSALRDSDVREVLHDVFEAIAKKTPSIAEPIIDKAESDGKITEAQADRLREMKRGGPRLHFKFEGPRRGRGAGFVLPAPPERPESPAALPPLSPA